MPQIGPLKIKAQLFSGGERALGPGRAALLEAIARVGSISAAGRELNMSYRYTWLLVDSMNRCFAAKLVETSVGGGRGGGAVLSETGRQVLEAYRALEQELSRVATSPALDDLCRLLRGRPDQAASVLAPLPANAQAKAIGRGPNPGS